MISASILGYMGILILLLLIFLGVPIYLSLAFTGVVGIIILMNLDAALVTLVSLADYWGCNWLMVTIPLFILMGEFAYHSGTSRDLYEAAHRFLGHLPGGLGMATTAACTAFGAVSGSSLANAGAMGVIAVPEMRRHGYDDALASGTVAAGGTIGVMMPPSVALIVLGAITGQSVGRLFIAGIIPALLMMAVFMMTIAVRVKLNPRLAPSVRHFSLKERLASLSGIWPILLIFVVVIGGIYIGFFTPTEAAAVGCFASFVFLVSRRRLTRKALISSLTDTIRISAMIFLLFIGANTFGNFLTLTGLPFAFCEWLEAMSVSPHVILWAILLFYVPLGCIMDLLSGWMVTLPIFYPIIESLGFNMIWFLILVEMTGELGLITPPVGLNVYVLRGVIDVPISTIFRGVAVFCLADFIVTVIIWAFPQICLWLPSMAMATH